MNNIPKRNVPEMQEASSSTTPFRKTLRLDNWFNVGKHKEPKESVIKLGKQKFVANSVEGIDAIHNAAKLLKTSKARHRSPSNFIINDDYIIICICFMFIQ